MSIAVISYVQADSRIGLGHAVRLQAIHNAFPFTYDHVLIGGGDKLPSSFKQGEVFGFDADIQEVVGKTLDAYDLVLFLIDHPSVPEEIWSLQGDKLVKVALDDVGSKDLRSDVVINGSATDRYHHYPNLPDWAVRLMGLDYLPLRQEFAAESCYAGQRCDGRSVGFVVGSSTAAEEWVYTILSVDFVKNDWRDVQVVVSPSMSSFEKAVATGQKRNVSVKTGLDAGQMVEFYRQFTVCVMTAGMAVYEALAVGAAVLAFPLLENMKPEARHLAGCGVMAQLSADRKDKVALTDTINELLSDGDTLAVFRERAASAVDGLGIQRITSILDRIVKGCLSGGEKKSMCVEARIV